MRRRLVMLAIGVLLCPHWAVAAEPTLGAMAAWNLHAAAAEARLENEQAAGRGAHEPAGNSIPVPGGTIHIWRGAVLVRSTRVNEVLDRLLHPGTPPPQEDVLEACVLRRSSDSLRVYLKLVRRAIVTVTYDTEHDVVFRRRSERVATSRSMSTRISEVGGRDRGFLWRLNSYWRYAQMGDDVLVELESLSLSRDVPAIVRPIAAPLISRIARESVTRTLAALKTYLEGKPRPRRTCIARHGSSPG